MERPVQSILHSNYIHSEVAQDAASRINELPKKQNTSSAVRASEFYGALEESDVAIVPMMPISQRLDMEHRKAYPRIVVAAQAIYAENH